MTAIACKTHRMHYNHLPVHLDKKYEKPRDDDVMRVTEERLQAFVLPGMMDF